MESQNRTMWIVVAAVLVVLCCCLMAAAVLVGGRLAGLGFYPGGRARAEGELIEQSFDLGGAPNIEIDNFAGDVSVRAGDGETIEVIAIKQVRRRSDLGSIVVDMSPGDGSLRVTTARPQSLTSVSVQLSIIAPAGTHLEARTGAGNLSIHDLEGGAKVQTGSGRMDLSGLSGGVDAGTGSGEIAASSLDGVVNLETGSGRVLLEAVSGEIDAHTGSGDMGVSRASGGTRLDTGSGAIRYEGTPRGDCRFETGSGGITLTLPDNLDIEVDLETQSGSVTVEFDVYDAAGAVTRQRVKGVVSEGSQGSITARTGSGDIRLVRR